MFGDNARSIKNGALVTNQTISGTGANHVAAKLLSLYYPFPNGEKQIYLSDPTWPNHLGIMSGAGIKPLKYKYVRKLCALSDAVRPDDAWPRLQGHGRFDRECGRRLRRPVARLCAQPDRR